MSDCSDGTCINLPNRIVKRLDTVIDGTEFASREEFVVFTLEEVLGSVQSDDEGQESAPERVEIENRLQSLGYLE